MKNYLHAVIVLCAAGMSGAQGQSSGDGLNRWMIVKNNSPIIVYTINIIPSRERECCWSSDLLRADTIEKGKSSRVSFDDQSKTCRFDIRIGGLDQQWQWREWNLDDVDVCNPSHGREIILEVPPLVKDTNKRVMTVKNDSQLTALNIYIIPSEEYCCWSDDMLGVRVISQQSSREVSFDDGSGKCVFDIRVTSIDPTKDWNFHKVNVCNTSGDKSTITLKEPSKSKDGKKRVMTVKNDSQLTASSVYIIPSSKDCCWSRDLLGADEIPKGESLRVDFDDRSGECTFDIRITRSDTGRDWYFKEKNVCDVPADKATITLEAPR